LLRDPDADDFAVDGFTSLPLLLVRMPAPLRDALVEYLSTAFDCRVSPLKLSSAFLSSSMELFLRRLGAKSSSGDSGALDKGVQVQLAFPTVAPALRNLDVSVPRDDIPGFLAHGHALQRSVAACSTSRSGPFTRALEYYMKHHLALDCSHPDVHVSKVVCGPLALSADGKIKLFAPQPLPGSEDGELSPSELATRDFYASLCALAGGETGSLAALARARAAAGLVDGEVAAPKRGEKRVLREVDLNAGTARTSKRRAKSVEEAHVEEAEEMDVLATGSPVAKARLASVPVEPPPPYELHDPRLLV
ncbi:MAG: hypothetical protein INR71_11665, partial [Terriglobus roseus]|nr:hypothetical protein [Terriglobus roseus]